jgi:NAD(P)H-hydrate repair Nnr-like enzyme with NAD(P)H-hydrate dehydratase domain
MVGAAILAGRAAPTWAPAGCSSACSTRPRCPWTSCARADVPRAPELLAEAGIAAFAVGPGLGQSDAAWTLVHAAIALPAQLVLDADALNLVARDPGLQAALAHRSRPAVLTRTPPRRPACSAPPPPTCRPTASPPPAGWPGS